MNLYFSILLEFLLVFSSILFLFKYRREIGLAPLFILLGSFQYLQAKLGNLTSIRVFDSYDIYPSSLILFGTVLFALLLIYIKEGAKSARALIFGIVISNIVMTLMFEIITMQQGIHYGENSSALSPDVYFLLNFKYCLIGTIILLVDFLLLAIVYQYLYSKVKKLPYFFILFIALFSVLIFDAFVYNFFMFFGTPAFSDMLIGQLIGKSLAAFVFSVTLYFYLKYFEAEKTKSATFIASQERSIFSIVRYKQKYLELKLENERTVNKLTSHVETTLNNISDGFVTLDANWNYTYLNKRGAEIIGRTPESLIGKNIWKEYPEGVGLNFYKAYHKALETQKTLYFQDYFEPMDRWFENRIYPSPEGLTIYFTDITDQKKAEANNNMLKSLIEVSDNFIGLANLEGKPLYLNANGRELVGLKEDDELTGDISMFFPEHYRDSIAKEHLPTIYEKKKWTGEVEFKHFVTGDLIPIEMSGFLIRDNDTDKPLALGIVASDITERKKARTDLINSEKLFRGLTSQAPAGIFQTTSSGSCNYVNEKWCEYAGISFDEAMGYGWASALHPDDSERVNKEWNELISSGESEIEIQFRFLHKDKKVTWVFVKTVGTFDDKNNLSGYIGMAIDITDRKKYEEKLIRSELLFREVTSNAPVGIFQTDSQGGCNFVNEEWMKYSGLSFKEAMGFGWSTAIHPDDYDRVINEWQEAMTAEKDFISDSRFITKQGVVTWMSVKAIGLYTDQNVLYGYIGMCLDITDRKAAEDKLIESEMLFRGLTSSAPVGIFKADNTGSCNFVNEEWLKYTGLTYNEAMGTGWLNSIHPDDKVAVLKEWENALDEGREYLLDSRFLNPQNNKITWVTVKAHGLYDDDKVLYGYMGVCVDITDRKAAEEELIKSEKYLENIINNIGDPVYVKDDKSRLLLVNNAFCTAFSLTRENIIGKTLAEETPVEQRDRILSIEKEVMATGVENVSEELVHVNDQESRSFSIKQTRYIEDNGTKLLIGVVRDVTERNIVEKQMAELQRKIEAAIRIGGIGYWSWDIKKDEVFWSDLMFDIYDVDRGTKLRYDSVLDVVHPEDKDFHNEITQDRIKNKSKESFEYRILRRDKSVKYVKVQMEVLDDEFGNAIKFQGTVVDVTEMKEAEINLVNSEMLFKRLASNAPVAIFQSDKYGACNYVNEEWMNYTGQNFNEAMGYGWSNGIHPDDKENAIKKWQNCIKSKENYIEEFRYINKKGEILWFSNKASAVYDANNIFIGYIGMTMDITRSKNAKDQEIKHKDYLNNIINNIGDPVFVKDDQSRMILVNDALCSIFNLSREQIIGKTLAENVPSEERERFLKHDKELLATGIVSVNQETVVLNKKEERTISTKKTRFIDNSGDRFIIGVVRDITKIKKVEQKLKESEQYLENILNNIGDPVFVKDDQSRIILANQAYCSIFGVDREEIIGSTFLRNLTKEEQENYLNVDKEVITTGNEIVREGLLPVSKTEPRYISTKKTRFIDDAGNKFLIGVIRDITESKKASVALQESEEKFSKVFRSSIVGFSIVNKEGVRIEVNEAMAKLLDSTPEFLIGKTPREAGLEVLDDYYYNEKNRLEEKIIKNGRLVNEPVDIKLVNGKKMDVLISVEPIDIAGVPHFLTSAVDITERKKVEEEIRKAHQRLTTHLNNSPLAIVEWGKNMVFTNWSVQAQNIFGWEKQEVLGKHFSEINFVYEEDKHEVGEIINQLNSRLVESNRLVNRNITKTGEVIYCEWYNSVLLTEDGEIENIFSLVQDITESKKSELELRESEDKFSKIFQSSVIGFSIVNSQNIRVDVNETMAKMLESTRDHLIGKTMEGAKVDVLDDAYYEQKRVYTEKLFKNRYLTNETLHRTLVSGKKLSMLVSVEPLEILGETHAFFAVIDITDKIQAEIALKESEEKFSKAFLANVLGMAIVNQNGKFVEVNNALLDILAITRDKIINNTIVEAQVFKINKSAKVNTFENVWRLFKEQGRINNFEAEIELDTGKTLVCLVSIDQIEIKGDKHALVTLNNISERKKIELELKKYRNNLEELVELRTNQLEKEKIRAQSADLMKSAFLATMSHELRTPMNSIIGFTGILLKEFAGPLNQEQKKQLGMVKNSSQHLLGLINDVLDISKIEAGKLKVSFAEFSYTKIIEKTISFILPQAEKKGLNIKNNINLNNANLYSDERRVEQILLNLLSNAIKFSNQGTIHVKVEETDAYVVTQIIDPGIGISKQNLTQLFKPFIQIDGGLNRTHEGTGLGLAICKSLIEKLGGTIKVESKKGKGSNFSFTIPKVNRDIKLK